MYIIVSDIVIKPHFVINIMKKIMLCPPPPRPPPPTQKKKKPNYQSQLLKG